MIRPGTSQRTAPAPPIEEAFLRPSAPKPLLLASSPFGTCAYCPRGDEVELALSPERMGAGKHAAAPRISLDPPAFLGLLDQARSQALAGGSVEALEALPLSRRQTRELSQLLEDSLASLLTVLLPHPGRTSC